MYTSIIIIYIAHNLNCACAIYLCYFAIMKVNIKCMFAVQCTHKYCTHNNGCIKITK